MIRLLRPLLLVLVAFAIVSGPGSQLARAARYGAAMTMAGDGSEMAMPAHAGGHPKPTMPCKGMTSDCVKQMACAVDIAVQAKPAIVKLVGADSAVDYWPAWSAVARLAYAPEPLPPRTT